MVKLQEDVHPLMGVDVVVRSPSSGMHHVKKNLAQWADS